MKNLVLTMLLLVGAFAGGCALFLTPVFIANPSSGGDMVPWWLGFAALTGAAIWGSTFLGIPPRRLWLYWALAILAGAGGWVLFLKLAFRGF